MFHLQSLNQIYMYTYLRFLSFIFRFMNEHTSCELVYGGRGGNDSFD